MKNRALNSVMLLLMLSAIASAQDLAAFEKRITLKKLDNGRKSKRCGIGLSSPYSHGTPGPRGCNESKNVEFRRYWI